MWRGPCIFVLILVAFALIAGPPEQAWYAQSDQQHNQSANPQAFDDSPKAPPAANDAGCPGTNQTKYDCNTISAIANIRQADVAERFNRLAVLEIGVGIGTAVVAFFAALFAKNAVAAARENLTHDKEAARAQLRAYIVLKQAFLQKFQAGEPVETSVELINVGNTPAYDVATRQALSIAAFPAADPVLPNADSKSVVGPGIVFHAWTDPSPPLPAVYVSAIKNGTYEGFLVGEVTYTDIFKRRHRTSYRMQIKVTDKGPRFVTSNLGHEAD